MPDPSAVQCQAIGGKTDDGMCRLDRAAIGAWTLSSVAFVGLSPTVAPREQVRERARTKRATVEFLRTDRAGRPKDELDYCEAVGGAIERWRRHPHTKPAPGKATCTFPDRSVIEAETLLRGPDAPGNQALRDMLLGKRTAPTGK